MSTVGRSKLGTLWIPASGRFLGCSSPRRESISGGEEFRGSDEAVVSNDPTGQHNPMASQGPLDGRVVGCWESCHIEPERFSNGQSLRDHVFLGDATAVAYKPGSWGVCGRHLNLETSSKVATDGPFEAVLGKTHRTEF